MEPTVQPRSIEYLNATWTRFNQTSPTRMQPHSVLTSHAHSSWLVSCAAASVRATLSAAAVVCRRRPLPPPAAPSSSCRVSNETSIGEESPAAAGYISFPVVLDGERTLAPTVFEGNDGDALAVDVDTGNLRISVCN